MTEQTRPAPFAKCSCGHNYAQHCQRAEGLTSPCLLCDCRDFKITEKKVG